MLDLLFYDATELHRTWAVKDIFSQLTTEWSKWGQIVFVMKNEYIAFEMDRQLYSFLVAYFSLEYLAYVPTIG